MNALEGGNDEASVSSENYQSPQNFDLFLPWACRQLQLKFEVVIINVLSKFLKVKSTEKTKLSAVGKRKISKNVICSDLSSAKSLNLVRTVHPSEKVIKIYTVYDNIGNLVQLKFDQNRNVPIQLLKLIGLVTHFHKYLSGITINSGLDLTCLHELSVLTSHANITDICLDSTHFGDGGYEILLEGISNLRNLSISRCRIKDDAIKKLASKLIHPLPASQTLSLLNLASNSVTDIGAKYLASALKTNRTLVYLNLSDNSITDEGAGAILDVLIEYPISNEDIVESRSRHFHYLREKKKIVDEILIELKSADFDKRSLKKRVAKPVAVTNAIGTNYSQRKGKDEIEDNTLWLEKAEFMAETKLGEFKEPYSHENIEAKDDLFYCKGNNHLAYINLSYNNLTYLTLKKIVSVLSYQKIKNRKPRGLVNIFIEGNCMPSTCPELKQIDLILGSYLSTPKRISTVSNALSLRGKKN